MRNESGHFFFLICSNRFVSSSKSISFSPAGCEPPAATSLGISGRSRKPAFGGDSPGFDEEPVAPPTAPDPPAASGSRDAAAPAPSAPIPTGALLIPPEGPQPHAPLLSAPGFCELTCGRDWSCGGCSPPGFFCPIVVKYDGGPNMSGSPIGGTEGIAGCYTRKLVNLPNNYYPIINQYLW